MRAQHLVRITATIFLFGCGAPEAAVVEEPASPADEKADAPGRTFACGDPNALLRPLDNFYEAMLPGLGDAMDDNDLRAKATLVPRTLGSTLLQGLGVREINGRFYPDRDVDWYKTTYHNDTQEQCVSCFNPTAGLSMRDEPIGPDPADYEVCVFVSTAEIAARGPMKCLSGTPATYYDLSGCCAPHDPAHNEIDSLRGAEMETPWTHLPGDSSTAYIRVRSRGASCQMYQLNYTHFWG